MPKSKIPLITSNYITTVKVRLPMTGMEYEQEKNKNSFLDDRNVGFNDFLPLIVPLKEDKPYIKEHGLDDSTIGKKFKKTKLKYTTQEVKKSIKEDESSLEDVENLEKHLKNDIQKAKNKI